jgi:hypothetical protein
MARAAIRFLGERNGDRPLITAPSGLRVAGFKHRSLPWSTIGVARTIDRVTPTA